MSRFGFKSGFCLLIAPVPVHCFSITFLDTQSSDISAEVIRESWRSFKSLIIWGKKLFICVLTSSGYLKGHRVLISAAPNLGNKVICKNSGFTFQTFIRGSGWGGGGGGVWYSLIIEKIDYYSPH